MAKDKGNQDMVVANGGSPGIRADVENSRTAPPTSNSPEKTPSTDRGRRSSRQQSQRRSDGGFNDTLDPLRALPELRPIPWYAGKELSKDKSTESSRVQTRGACLLASRGIVNDPPCTHCQSGVGRFSLCVSLEDWFHGACATCQLATRGNLCSLRTDKEIGVKSESEQQDSETPSAKMAAPSKVSKRKPAESSNTPASRARKSNAIPSQNEPREDAPAAAIKTTMNPPSVHTLSATRPEDEYKSQFGVKRKRESLQGTSVFKPYVSPYAPLDPPNRLTSSLPNTPVLASTPNMIMPASIARNHYSYNHYIRESQQNIVVPQPTRQPPVPVGFKPVNGNGHRKPPTIIETNRNTTAITAFDRDRTESMSPSAQLLDQPSKAPLQATSPENLANSTEPTRMTTRNSRKKATTNGTATQSNSSKALNPPDPPLIDTLPRRKQKQILGMISGLRSGIRGWQQHAEQMQKQLDNISAALGIEIEEDNHTAKI